MPQIMTFEVNGEVDGFGGIDWFITEEKNIYEIFIACINIYGFN